MSDSTQGYAEEAPELLRRYETYPFERAHAAVLHLLPQQPCDVLDIGAGTGRDAAYFAECGHRVVAAEPTAAMRDGAIALHPSPAITWIDDRLPGLTAVSSTGRRFDLLWLSAVWMHLDRGEREQAITVLAALLRDRGAMMMTLRHGPVPPGRRMFDVRGEETTALAESAGLRRVFVGEEASRSGPNAANGVTWTRLWFVKG